MGAGEFRPREALTAATFIKTLALLLITCVMRYAIFVVFAMVCLGVVSVGGGLKI